MPITYDVLEPSNDYEASVKKLSEVIGPLCVKSWEENKKANYGKPFNLNVVVFTQLWYSKTLKLFVARKDDEIIGFLCGMVFRPLPYDASVFQIEDWYAGGDHVVEEGLFNFLAQALKFIGCDEIWVSTSVGKSLPVMPGWSEKNQFTQHRFLKE